MPHRDNPSPAFPQRAPLGDWASPFRGLLNPGLAQPIKSQRGAPALSAQRALSSALGGEGREGGGGDVQRDAYTGSISPVGPMGRAERIGLSVFGAAIPGASLATLPTSLANWFGLSGATEQEPGPVAPGSPAFSQFTTALNTAYDQSRDLFDPQMAQETQERSDYFGTAEALADTLAAMESRDGGTMGDVGGSRVDNSGPSGARDDIGTRDGRDGGGGGFGRGNDPGGGAAGSPFHQGGPITDRDPETYQDDMPINAQEGEYMLNRGAVDTFGEDLLSWMNQKGQDNGDGNMMMNYGMPRKRMDAGGLIGGQRNDRVPIDAQPGEFVVSRPAVGAFGPKFFQNLNNAALGQSGAGPSVPLGGATGVPGAGGSVTASATPAAPSAPVGAPSGAVPAVPASIPGAGATPAIPPTIGATRGIPSALGGGASPAIPTLPPQALANANAMAFSRAGPFQGNAAPQARARPGIPALPPQAQIPGLADPAFRNAAVQALKYGRPFV